MISPRSLLARIGWSEGDLWTVSLGLVVALSLAISSIPAALHPHQQKALAATAPVAAPEPATTPPLVVLPPPAQATTELPVPFQPEPAVPQEQGPPPAPSGPAASNPAPPTQPVPRPTVPAGALLPFAVLAVDGTAGGLTTGPDGFVQAATDAPGEAGGASSLLTWDALGAAVGRTTVPGQPAARQRGLTALATTASGAVLATDSATSRLLSYDPPTQAWSTIATVPDVGPCLLPGPAACQPGLQNTKPLLRGLTIDSEGTVYVADAGQGTIWRLTTGASSFTSWYSAPDLLGAQALAGLDTDASGAVVLAVTRLSGVTADGSGALDRIALGSNGAAGARTTVTSFAPGEELIDVAIGSTGIYVALRGTSAVVTLGPDGAERLRVTGAILTAPTALSLSDGRVLVTSGGSRPAVLQVGVADRLT